MRRFGFAFVALLAFALLSASAKASPITYSISFTASGSVPASGSYTLTFDPTVVYTDQTSGLVVNSFSDTFAVPSQVGFTYYTPSGAFPGGYLLIGGLATGVAAVASGSTDYVLGISTFTTNPAFGIFIASSSTSPGINLVDNTGTVTVTQAAAPTPEPSALLLLGTGLAGIAGALRKRLVA